MAIGGTDRRIRRTRDRLRRALQELIVERGYDAVTVQTILDRADVGRSTFYAHYRDKDDLLVSGFQVLHAELEDSLLDAGPSARPSISDIALVLLRHAERDRPAFRAIMGGRSGEVVIRHARRYLEDHVREHVQAAGANGLDPAVKEAIVRFVVSALLAMTSWWLDSDYPLSADDMHALFMGLTMPGVDDMLSGTR